MEHRVNTRISADRSDTRSGIQRGGGKQKRVIAEAIDVSLLPASSEISNLRSGTCLETGIKSPSGEGAPYVGAKALNSSWGLHIQEKMRTRPVAFARSGAIGDVQGADLRSVYQTSPRLQCLALILTGGTSGVDWIAGEDFSSLSAVGILSKNRSKASLLRWESIVFF